MESHAAYVPRVLRCLIVIVKGVNLSMSKGKPRHNPDKPQNKIGNWCRFAEDFPNTDYIYCEAGYDASFCKGNPHKCKKAWYRSQSRRSDRRKNIDGTY